MDLCINNRMTVWLPCVIEIPIFNANSVDPNQTPCSAAYDLSLHCLPMSLERESRHKWVELKHTKRRVLSHI